MNPNHVRAGCRDMWNAFMLEGATFTANDIPICPCTAKEPPSELISYEQARLIYNQHRRNGVSDFFVNAFVHFYMDDYKFDGPVSGVWNAPRRSWDILSHFAGLITPDFSTCADFPFPVKCYNTYRMRAYGYWYGTQGGSVINNVRWGTKETFSYCFDGIPQESIVAIGVVASGLKECHNRPVFEQGFYRMLDVLNPRTIVVYGSDKYHCFDVVRKRVNIIAFPSETSMAFGRRKA